MGLIKSTSQSHVEYLVLNSCSVKCIVNDDDDDDVLVNDENDDGSDAGLKTVGHSVDIVWS